MEETAALNAKLKFISEELSRPPFNHDFNAVAFASLGSESLMNVLHEVLTDVDPRFGESTGRNRNASMYSKKVLTLLQVLRYRSDDYDQETLWRGVEDPIPEVVWDIIYWIFDNYTQLKQRAYLAQYLVKIPVPNEFLMDKDVDECYSKYEDKISQFKEVHKRLHELKNQSEKKPLRELVSDSEKLDHEIECVSKKLDSLKTRVNLNSEKELLLTKVREMRKAKEGRQKIVNQKNLEEQKLSQITRRVELQRYMFKAMTKSDDYSTPEASVERLKQDVEILRLVVHDRLPKQIEATSRILMAMMKVEENPPIGRMDLEPTAMKLMEIKREIRCLESELNAKGQDPAVNFARKKIVEARRRKLELADDVDATKDDLLTLQRILEERIIERERYNEGMPTQEGYKEYIKQMRNKTATYKAVRTELQGLQNEVSQLSATKMIVEKDLRESEDELRRVEEELGIVGFTRTESETENLSTEKSKVDEVKMNSIYEMAVLAKELDEKIADKTVFFQHVMGEVSCKRNEYQEMVNTLRGMKAQALIEMTPIYEDQMHLEKQIEESSEAYSKNQVEYAKMQAEIPLLKSHIFRAHDVERCMGVKVRSYREILLSKIAENERYNGGLTVETEGFQEEEDYSLNQKILWNNLALILEKKITAIKNPSEPVIMQDDEDEEDYYEDDNLLRHILPDENNLMHFEFE